jgi:hypothetical protein
MATSGQEENIDLLEELLVVAERDSANDRFAKEDHRHKQVFLRRKELHGIDPFVFVFLEENKCQKNT